VRRRLFRRERDQRQLEAHGEGTRFLRHPVLGALERDYAGFAAGGRPGLGMIVHTPCKPEDAEKIRRLAHAVA